MNAYKSELYTMFRLPAVRLVAALCVLMSGVGASLQWSLPFLLKIDPPTATDGPAGEQVAALIAASDPALERFQLAAMDITGSGQSSGISAFLIAMVALGIVAAVIPFGSGAVVWKVAQQSRLKWAVSQLLALLTLVLLCVIAACGLNVVIGLMAAGMHGVTLHFSATHFAVWARGIAALLLLVIAIYGVVLAVRKSGQSVGIIVGIVMVGVIVGTVGSLAGWSPAVFGWLPTSAVSAAGGMNLGETLSPALGLLSLAGWAVVSAGIGLIRFSRANL
ncbi:hypothetical protein QVA66_03100 [Staphylococcus chromogenes]|nr:hypothetical protein [Staphylococcus chromogenes]